MEPLSRKRRRFTVNFKLYCVRQYELNKNCSKIAKENKLSRVTLRGWIKNKKSLQNVKHKRNIFLLNESLI